MCYVTAGKGSGLSLPVLPLSVCLCCSRENLSERSCIICVHVDRKKSVVQLCRLLSSFHSAPTQWTEAQRAVIPPPGSSRAEEILQWSKWIFKPQHCSTHSFFLSLHNSCASLSGACFTLLQIAWTLQSFSRRRDGELNFTCVAEMKLT